MEFTAFPKRAVEGSAQQVKGDHRGAVGGNTGHGQGHVHISRHYLPSLVFASTALPLPPPLPLSTYEAITIGQMS